MSNGRLPRIERVDVGIDPYDKTEKISYISE